MPKGDGKCLDEELCFRVNGACTSERMVKGCMPGIKEEISESFLFIFLLRKLLEEGVLLYDDPMIETFFEIYQRNGGTRRKEVEDKAVISFFVRTNRGEAHKIHLG